jgi:hypothetical protein
MHGERLFAGIENVKGRFLFDVASVHEIEHPFRSCNHALYIHFWPRKALVLGWWKKRHNETDNLLLAVQGRNLDGTQVGEVDTTGILRGVLPVGPEKIETDEFS